ncbi:JAB domain-containing protein [Arcicella sp. DC2W]|uniref:JAB domain-containing protein n=1 Tax=Arcicella gelida TaxID=2984195 RepID=A0ABU5S1D2_9BACT|nr:JAB domain-containing protein [Arcicella sp. DC2W]MEA5402108.1 JAB domain-containing protein [Arcicella sp. DC2W]
MSKKNTAVQLFKVAEIELVYRSKIKAQDRPLVTHSFEAYEILRGTWDDNKIELLEQFKIMLLDRKNSCLGITEIASGGTDFCPIDPRLIFMTALKANASAIVLAHNHPSGNLKESKSDIELTKRVIQAGDLLGIRVLDHLIITADGYASFEDKLLMPR